MKGLVLDAVFEPKPDYRVSDWEEETGKAITGNSVWRHPKLEVREKPDPVIKPDQILLEVQACGVCGSDMHFYETDEDDYIRYPGLTKFPSILGHELSGKVVEVGKEVTDLKDVMSVIDFAITREKDSIALYQALMPHVTLRSKDVLENIINEEKRHLEELSRLKTGPF